MKLFLVSPATFAAPTVTVRLTTTPKKPVIEYLRLKALKLARLNNGV